MLTNLTIKNFGLIDEIEFSPDPQLNVLTGATGAGKSIIIDGLRFALGERLRSSQIRDDDKPCVVEAVFHLKKELVAQYDILQELISDEDFLLVIYREANADGKTKIKINGRAVTVAQLKIVGNHLMDFHGPHDHQMLLAEECHLPMLDRLVDFGDLKEKYHLKFKDYVTLTLELNDLQLMAQSRERDLDLLSHQIKELEQVPLDENSYQELVQRQARLGNTERLAEAASSLLQLLENDEIGISENIRRAFGCCHILTENDHGAKIFEDRLLSMQDSTDELTTGLRDYLESLSFEPGEAEEINNKYDRYEDLKRKYGPSIDDVSEFYLSARQKYDMLIDWGHNDQELKQRIKDSELELAKLADKISGLRKTAAKILITTIEIELKDLGIQHVEFDIRFHEVGFQKDGRDKVVFYISPNAGEELKPLADIVSSGEAARLMLALKKALTKADPIPVLIFDEIDAQIGGRLGDITGRKLKELSVDRQVILITHLPQIAAFGDIHVHVDKVVKDGRTFTNIFELDHDGRINELAHMMGGGKYSDTIIEHAKEMLAQAQ